MPALLADVDAGRCCRTGRRRCGPRRCGRGGSRRRAARADCRSARASAKRCTCACAAAAERRRRCRPASRAPSLPSTCVSNVCGLLRLNTTRVRLPAWTKLQAAQRGVVDGALVVRRARCRCRGNRARCAAGWRSRSRRADWPAASFSVKRTIVRPDGAARHRDLLDAVRRLRERGAGAAPARRAPRRARSNPGRAPGLPSRAALIVADSRSFFAAPVF